MSIKWKMPQYNGDKMETLLTVVDKNEEIISTGVFTKELDDDSEYNKAMIGVILNEHKNIIAFIYYHVRYDEGKPSLNLLKAVQVRMAHRIQYILKNNGEHSIKVDSPFGEIFKKGGISDQVVNCYFHTFKGNEYLHSRLGYLNKDKLEKMSSSCYMFIYKIGKILQNEIKAYYMCSITGGCANFELTRSQSQAPILCNKSFRTGNGYKGNKVAVVGTEVISLKPDLQTRTRIKLIASYITGFLIGWLLDLRTTYNYIFYSH